MKNLLILAGIALLIFSACSNKSTEKKLHLPDTVYRIGATAHFDSDTNAYSFSRFRDGENVVAFWHKVYGEDPSQLPDTSRLKFDLNFAMEEMERYFNYYVDTLKFVEKGNSHTDSLKMILWVIPSPDQGSGTAFGGGDEGVGMMWTPATRMSVQPFGVLAHELGHSFQNLARQDGGKGVGGGFGEMASQFMLWHVYPEWMTFENYHLEAFMDNTHLAFMHEQNIYRSPYVLEYWATLHGIDVIGRMYRDSSINNRDPVIIYKEMFDVDQEQFIAEMFDASRRFITWDLPHAQEVARQYRNQHYTLLQETEEGWYQISPEKAPQNYGYNGIKLELPEEGNTINLSFEGIAGAEGYNAVHLDSASWRYGFVAYLDDETRVYSDMYSEDQAEVSFDVPDNTENLWLVVMGAPDGHWTHRRQRRWRGNDNEEGPPPVVNEAWPYKFKLEGTVVAPEMLTNDEI